MLNLSLCISGLQGEKRAQLRNSIRAACHENSVVRKFITVHSPYSQKYSPSKANVHGDCRSNQWFLQISFTLVKYSDAESRRGFENKVYWTFPMKGQDRSELFTWRGNRWQSCREWPAKLTQTMTKHIELFHLHQLKVHLLTLSWTQKTKSRSDRFLLHLSLDFRLALL